MTNAEQKPFTERRSRARKEIKQLLGERNRVLSQFYHLAKIADGESNENDEPILNLLQEFCQELVDYLATGHFELYRRVEDGEERRIEIINLAKSIFEKITDTTEIAIDFNDLYDSKSNDPNESVKNLPSQLSILGESLAIRMDLEDQFINTLLKPKTQPSLHTV